MADETKTATTETIANTTTGAAAETGAASTATEAKADTAAAVSTETKTADTLLAGDGKAAETETKQVAPADFPENWRQKLAGEDKSFLKTLERFAAPTDLAKAYRAAQQKLTSGELKKPLPDNPSAEELATYRKENGIPEKAEDYEVKVEGLVFGDADKPMLDSFKTHAHGKNWSPALLNDALSWYAKEQEAIAARQAETDDQFRQQSRDALYTEWGAQDFRRNVNAVSNLLSGAPEGLKDRLLGARLADGRLLGDDPAALKWLANLSRDINPAATLVPVGTSDPGKTVESELADIRKFRTENPNGYDADKKMQARELELLEAQQKMKSRAA